MANYIRAAFCFCLLATSTNAGQIMLPTTLDTLLSEGDYALVDGLQFDDFRYIASGDMPIPSQINVEAADYGLRFTGPFVDLPGGVGNGGSDATLGFRVTSDSTFNTVSMLGNPSILDGTGVAAVTETFVGLPTVKLDIYDQHNGPTPLNTEASASIPATSSLTVIKDILLLTTDNTQSATLSVIEQTFVPEPSAGMMMLLGGLLLVRRRRNR